MLGSFQEPLEEEEEKDSDDEEEEEEKASNLPMMVPMADMLNHVSNHNAHLEYTPVRRRPLHLRSTCDVAWLHSAFLCNFFDLISLQLRPHTGHLFPDRPDIFYFISTHF